MVKITIVIPVYQHGSELAKTIETLEIFELPIIVVNDGSDDFQSQVIKDVCMRDNITLYERDTNGGKGSAVIDGLTIAKSQGYTHAFQIDADGQHDIEVIPIFIEACIKNETALILGYPKYDSSVPASREAARWLTHIWVWINSLSFRVRDSMCGFRIYPLNAILNLVNSTRIGKHMEFDVEICVRACWANIKTKNLPVNVIYLEGGKSNFRIWDDNVLLTLMHTQLFIGMLVRLPFLLFTRIRTLFQ